MTRVGELAPHSERPTLHHGELLLDIIGLAVIGILGILPLLIVHYTDHRPILHLPRREKSLLFNGVWSSALVVLTNWTNQIVL